MANEEQLAILKQGVEAWNNWRKKNENVNVKIDLEGAELGEAELGGADLSDAHLRGAYLRGTRLRGSVLHGANLIDTDLIDTDLIEADLRKADLSVADLRGVDLRGTDLRGAKLNKAIALATKFINLDLSEVIGLEEIEHQFASTIGTDTIQLSKGRIPEAFLRGCGLSDIDIEYSKIYNPDLTNEETNKIVYQIYDLRATQAIQINPLFISYSHGDTEFVDRMDKALTEKGVRFWRDIHDLKAGRIETQIDRAIQQNRIVLLVLSERSLASDWVEHEVRKARTLEKELGRDVLCPVALDESWKESKWPERLMEQVMEYNILDFSKWEDKATFDEKFAKLLQGLDLFYKKPEG